MAHTYRTFKQLLRLAKTRRRLGSGANKRKNSRSRKQSRRTRRNPFRGGAGTPLTVDTTVVARIPGDESEPENPPVVQSVVAFEKAIQNQ